MKVIIKDTLYNIYHLVYYYSQC